MGKHSRKDSNRVAFICRDCLYLTGKTDNCLATNARYYNSDCDICHRRKLVFSAQDCGFFPPGVVAMAKSKLKSFGIDKRTFADTSGVKAMIDVAEKVLGKHKSDATKQLIKDITDKLAKGLPIELFYAKQLTYAFTQDAAALKQTEEAKPKKKKKEGLVKKAPGLVVIEGGREREVEEIKDAE